jgi:hypothetical protein
MRKLMLAALAAAPGLVWAGPVEGQASCAATHATLATCNITRNMTVTVHRMVVLHWVSGVTALTEPTAAAFEAANSATIHLIETPHALTVRANAAWVLQIHTTGWTHNAVAYTAKNTDLQYEATGPVWTAVPLGAADRVQIASGAAIASHSVNLPLRVRWNIHESPPGAYAVDLIYTLSSP